MQSCQILKLIFAELLAVKLEMYFDVFFHKNDFTSSVKGRRGEGLIGWFTSFLAADALTFLLSAF